MVGRASHAESSCTLARPLGEIGDGWSLLIVREAFDGLRRFGEFQKSLGLAKNILASRLSTLVENGILEVVPAGGRHEYQLTEKGRGLFPVLVALRQWSGEFCFRPGEPRVSLIDRKTSSPVRRFELRAADGRLLAPEDTTVAQTAG
ncbi:winged helix-turn-helix transcriptional regulator [Mycobacteroides abscessus]|uniref:winged helix-turn-helix transcriptional regulator n=1 Tax=Mycobacteroides abscessus TaxID=36809 RepID=UPI0002683898|nr:helix-turn-helix domain-containing protein [Mycobacteroides abscessus]EIT90124.1 putative HTH-type transcriptional regulator YtfH [Mycobacteroides abscessus 4S-0303]EIT92118.1 putative HTH-type transcriptional regulator YtfH [Mycobacteroides abscessus 4S-0726-RB]EIT95668.1 putative HTH-type transcriptional regulator YtfH [Mycobacteroides abscessus 4S-0726-RA]EIV09541.1 putative HTH-type transcriptional regulator YtfH [Mycobacteroides abscessus 4S-0206]EIV47737.1 putative HTH-type transcript